MKTNIYTDRYETVIPDSLRRRYRAPGGTIPKPIRNEAPPLPNKIPFPWIFAGMITLLIGVASTGPILAYLADQKDKAETAPAVVTPVATPAATPVHEPTQELAKPTIPIGTVPSGHIQLSAPAPVLEPTPFPQSELDAAVRSLAPEARRAEPVTGNVLYKGQVVMPYGGTQAVRVLGILPNQEALPAMGDHIGDAYVIGRYMFVWVAPGGVGQWIDPIVTQ